MCSKSETKKKINGIGTISQFFPRIRTPKKELHAPEESAVDVIEATPEKKPPILANATNRFLHSTVLEKEKKRKKGCYPDEIPDLDIELPQRKKPFMPKDGVKVLSLNDISKEDFENYQIDLEKRNSRSKIADKMTTPQKSPKRGAIDKKRKTPAKLFEKSPKNVNEFKVEILQNFVRITPSKSEKNICEWIEAKSPAKSAEKKQLSITNFTSPCHSRTNAIKNSNETTPVNRPSVSGRTPSSKVKIKLDFTLSNTFVTVLPKTSIKMESNDNWDTAPQLKSPDLIFDDSWDEQFQFTANYSLDLSVLQHCKVIELTTTTTRVTIIVESTKNDEKAICFIADFWLQTYLEVGCTVSIQAYRKCNDWTIDNKDGMLIFEPDHLISTTSIVNAIFCKRRALLKNRFVGFDAQNKIMIVGIIVHRLLQESLKRRLQTKDAIRTVAQTILTSSRIIKELFYASLTVQEIAEDVNKFVENIVTFMKQHLASSNFTAIPNSIAPDNWRGKIDSIQDIEENICCPELGIKGKVDVSVKVGLETLPLELKTGRTSMSLEHRGQVILYITMMKKLGYNVSSGLLLYLREGVVRDIPMAKNEKRDLLILRNDLAFHSTRKPFVNPSSSQETIGDIEDLVVAKLPAPINHRTVCGNCEYKLLCSIYVKNEGWNLDEYKNMQALQTTLLAHLSESHLQYFHHWCGLLDLEDDGSDGKAFREIYVKPADEREKQGRCVTDMKLSGDVSDIHGIYSTTFIRDEQCDQEGTPLNTRIAETEYVVVSTKKRPAIASGLVSRADEKSITIGLDRDLSKLFPKSLFILDTYDSSSMSGFNYTTLALLMNCDERASHLRELIIDLKPPMFKRTLPRSVGVKAGVFLKNMNSAQQRAIIKSVAAQDYLLIKGMPGTGKTATIVTLVRVLVALNYSVLITSHTNSAVDNVCLRLVDCGVRLLRLGCEGRIHANLKKFSEHYQTRSCKTPEELDKVYNKANVLAVTCLGSKHPILSKRNFDFCIVDESTQVLQCSVIRVLHSSKTFILIGDADQLPPTVRNRDAITRGMSESLFARLQNINESTITLQLNYRMNKTITELANNLTYDGKLLIANDNVGNANLRFSKFEGLTNSCMDRQWVLNALSDRMDEAVVILDTGPVWNKTCNVDWMKHTSEEISVTANVFECAIVVILVDALMKGGIMSANIGVIAPYKVQVSLLATLLKRFEVDVNTVDQFQGKDKEVIIYSCTKSRDITQQQRPSKFEILEDQRRLTVAITRAKHKLIVLADVGTIREFAPFKKLFAHVDQNCYMEMVDGTNGFTWEGVLNECGNLTSEK